MTDHFRPVQRVGTPKVSLLDGGNAESDIKVDIELSDTPDRTWIGLFNANPKGIPRRISFRAEVVTNWIKGTCSQHLLEEFVGFIDQLIAGANESYVQDVLPAREASERQQAAEQDETSRRQAELQKQAERVKPPSAT